jgi:hypothetical protein
VLTYYEELPNRTAAETLDMNLKAFESLLFRARGALSERPRGARGDRPKEREMMSDTPFSPEMRRALDGFAPPAPAPGFADRALERVRARDAAPPLPKPLRRWRSASPWRRAG